MHHNFQSVGVRDDLCNLYSRRAPPMGVIGVGLLGLLGCASTITSLLGAVAMVN